MSNLSEIALRIIKEQESVIGPVAWSEARKVVGLQITNENVQIPGDVSFQKNIIDSLITQYENIFGGASREVCKQAAAPLIADMSISEIPDSLK